MRILLTLSLIVMLLAIACSDESEVAPPEGGVEFSYLEPTDERDSVLIQMIGVDTLTVFDLLKKALPEKHMSSVKGAFVTYIDDIGGPDEYFWIYTINGELVSEACDRFTPESGDIICWHYRGSGLAENK